MPVPLATLLTADAQFPLLSLIVGIAPLVGYGIAAGASALSGLLSGRNKTITTKSEANLSPIQQQVQLGLGNQILNDLNSPVTPPNVTPLRSAARNQVNRATNAAGGRLDAALAGSGFYNSGKRAAGRQQLETARIGGFSNIESDLVQYLLDYEQQEKQRRRQAALSFLPNTSAQTTTQTGGSGSAAGGVGAGVETLTTLFYLDKLLGGGGGGSPNEIDLGGYFGGFGLE